MILKNYLSNVLYQEKKKEREIILFLHIMLNYSFKFRSSYPSFYKLDVRNHIFHLNEFLDEGYLLRLREYQNFQ